MGRTLDMAAGAGRALSLALGLFVGANLMGALFGSRLDANSWWIDLAALPPLLRPLLLAATALLLSAHGLGIHVPAPRLSTRLPLPGLLVAACLLAITCADTLAFWSLLSRSVLASAIPLPFSLAVSLALATIIWSMVAGARSPAGRSHRAGRVAFVATLALVPVAFPLGQMVLYGATDYRRSADAAVVLGCRAWPDGRLSPSLEDRVRTGCDLYRQGLVGRLIFSGGPIAGVGNRELTEPAMMRRWALARGIPAGAITIDPRGVDTAATAANMVPIFARLGIRRALAVSHSYHLARVKLSFQEVGLKVYTVPAHRTGPLPGLAWYMTREVVGLWYYYLASLLG